MLIRVSVENYKSFNEQAELSMVSSSKIQKKPGHVTMVNGAKLLRFAALYGANAAGKTNLIDAIRLIKQTVQFGLPLESRTHYCRISPQNQTRNSVFEIQFNVGDRVFAYGFSVVLSERRFTEEWLFELQKKGAKRLFQHDISGQQGIVTELELSDDEAQRFGIYASDFNGSESRLFLSELNRSKQFSKESPLYAFKQAYDWITSKLVVMAPMQPAPDMNYLLQDDALENAGELIGSFDTGVSKIRTRPIDDDELKERIPRTLLNNMIDEVQRSFDSGEVKRVSGSVRGSTGLFVINFYPDGEYDAVEIQLEHHGARSIFTYDEESDGTRRLLDIMSVLFDNREDVTFIMDEVERSLHPMLVRRFLELFEARARNVRTQLIFSTHESSIMDQDIFRRDEIWFIDRSQSGASRIYSLDRFKERFDKDIEKAYLEGRYGAIPIFSKVTLFSKEGD